MKPDFIEEPELEFGNGGYHIDIRHGIDAYGPLDINSDCAPRQIRVGMVGTALTLDGVSEWLQKCERGIPAKPSRHTHLFPGFPGFTQEGCFRSRLFVEDSLKMQLSLQQIEDLFAHADGQGVALAGAVDLLFESMQDLVARSRPDVLLCAIPDEFSVFDYQPDENLTEDPREPNDQFEHLIDFRSYLKAKAMQLGIPIQLVLPATYGGKQRDKRKKRRPGTLRRLQDEATRAWNLYTALYYKAGGRPWRLPRISTDYQTCFVGISFYKSLEENSLLSSLAQIYNERGEGIIVRGAPVKTSREEPQPHLSEAESYALLTDALARYRAEHKTTPARLVLHKTSNFNAAERGGFVNAIRAQDIDQWDFLTVDRTPIRLFRHGAYPPLRGTVLELDSAHTLLYTRGSVNFFSTYPGMYVPRPLLIKRVEGQTPSSRLAEEILGLTKINWNNTQFDGGMPLTLRVAEQVGKILKYVPDGWAIQSSYAFYM
jgi:hypothetical protein